MNRFYWIDQTIFLTSPNWVWTPWCVPT